VSAPEELRSGVGPAHARATVRLLGRVHAEDLLPLVAAAAIPIVFLHERYQWKLASGVYSSDLAVAAVVLAALASAFIFGWEPLGRGRWLWALAAAFIGIQLVACFYRPEELLGSRLHTIARLVEYMLLAPACVLLFRRAVDFDRFLAVFVAWALAAGLWGVLMFFAIVDDPQGPRPGQREVSFLGHQNYGAFTGATLAAGFAALALGERKRLAIAAIVGGSLGVILDASVFVYLGVLVAAVAIAAATALSRTLTLRRGLALGAILLVVGAGVGVLRGSDVTSYLGFLGVTEPAKTTDQGVQTGQQRTMLLWMGWEMWKNNPLLGIGFLRSNTDFAPYLAAMRRKFPKQPRLAYPSNAHQWGVQNYFVELATDTGIVGLALGLATFGYGLVLAFREARGSPLLGLVAAGFVLVVAGAWLAVGITAGIPMDAVTWIGLGLAAAAIPPTLAAHPGGPG
jgi:O-Antigen ligase